jgi:diguanylate cyclase (GGDEF)-like protein
VAGLVEDLTALRALLPQTPHTVAIIDAALTAAVAAYVDETTAILEARATRDPLTGLPNRATLAEALDHEIRAAVRGTPPALLLIDLDGFKGVNDTDGHLAGDAVLVGVAELLTAQVRGGDLACRLGGDEFAVLLPRTSQAQAVKIARRIVAASRQDLGLASPSARVRLSVGVGWLATPGSADELVALADTAMYAAKAAGGDDVHVASAPAEPA